MIQRTIRDSLLSLTAIQAANFIVPLFAVPWLTRTLGINAWGEVAYVIFAMQICLVLTDYGFSLSAVRSIARSKENLDKVSTIFSACWSIQWILLFLTALISTVSFTILDLKPLYLVGFSLVLGNILCPIWLFQGLEQLKAPAVAQLLSRFLMLGLIYTFVTGPEDAWLALFLITGHNLVAGPILLFRLFRRRQLSYSIPSLATISRYAKEGWGIFVSKIFVSSYTSLIPFFLGNISGNASVGLYYVADKIRVAASYSLSPISLALFPRSSKLFKDDLQAGRKLVLKYGSVLFCLSVVFSIAIFFLSEFLISLLADIEFLDAVPLLRIMAFTPTFVAISNIIGTQILLPLGLIQQYNKSIIFGAIFALLSIRPMILFLGPAGAALVSVLAESVVSIMMIIYFFSSPKSSRLVR